MGMSFKYKPEQLLKKYEEYLEWLPSQGYTKREPIKSGNRAGEIIEYKIPMPQTIEGFCLFANITVQTFWNYCNNQNEKLTEEEKSKADYKNTRNLFEVSTRIKTAIENYQKGGAINNEFNGGFIARLQGIADKQEIDSNTTGSVNISINSKKVESSDLIE